MADLAQRPQNTRPVARPGSLFGELLGWDPFGSVAQAAAGADVTRTENGYSVEIPVPGFAPEQVSVTLEDDVLTVEARSEKRTLRRAIVVPEDVDAENVQAEVQHGMLALTLQLHPKRQPRRIAINAG